MIARRPGVGGWPVRSRPVPVPGRATAGIATVMSDPFRGVGALVCAGASFGGADADSDQVAGYRPDAGAGVRWSGSWAVPRRQCRSVLVAVAPGRPGPS